MQSCGLIPSGLQQSICIKRGEPIVADALRVGERAVLAHPQPAIKLRAQMLEELAVDLRLDGADRIPPVDRNGGLRLPDKRRGAHAEHDRGQRCSNSLHPGPIMSGHPPPVFADPESSNQAPRSARNRALARQDAPCCASARHLAHGLVPARTGAKLQGDAGEQSGKQRVAAGSRPAMRIRRRWRCRPASGWPAER